MTTSHRGIDNRRWTPSRARSTGVGRATGQAVAAPARCPLPAPLHDRRRGARAARTGLGRGGGPSTRRQAARRRHLVVDRVPRQSRGVGRRHLGRHLLPRHTGLAVARARRPGLRRAPRIRRAGLCRHRERHRLRAGGRHGRRAVVDQRRNRGAGDGRVRRHLSDGGDHRHARDRRRPRRDLRRGRRAGQRDAGPRSRRAEHVHRGAGAQRVRRRARRESRLQPAAHGVEPRRRPRHLRIRGRLPVLSALRRLGRLRGRGRRDPEFYDTTGSTAQRNPGRGLDGGRGARGRRRRQHLVGDRRRRDDHPLRRQRLDHRALTPAGAGAAVRAEQLVGRQHRRP